MEQMRKRIMRCEHPTPCAICLDDCKRAEITAKENEIRDDLLAVCEISTICFRKLAGIEMLATSKHVLLDNAILIEATLKKARKA